MKCYLSYLLGLSLILVNVINARSIEKLSNADKTSEDKYYLCYVSNDHGEYKVFADDKTQKRGSSQLFIENLVNEINTLIVDNKDTYQNPEKLEEIEEAAQLKKRAEDATATYNESDFVYPISSVKDRVVLYAYLSKTLADELPSKFENVVECLPDKAKFKKFHKNYDVAEILAETQWKNLSVRENADQHLSLLSQGKVSQKGKYDTNYYYPASAGKGVDLVFVDSSFNFGYSEFSNTNERTVECTGIVRNGVVSTNVSGGCDISTVYHGESTSATAAGLTNGVANLANVYGVAVPTTARGELKDSDILGAIQYVYENMIRPHKTVINFSIGGMEEIGSQTHRQYKAVLDAITQKGGINVAAAGNESINLDSRQYQNYIALPCELDNVICVGGTDNSGRNMYGLVDFTNYGKNVDIYAPSHVKVQILIKNRVKLDETDGTSFSCPLVAGLIATLISENSHIKYTKDTMYQQLYENGKNLTIRVNGRDSILANNGKNIVYTGEPLTPSKPTTTTTPVKPRTTTTRRTTTTTTTTRRTTTTTTKKPQPTSKYACYGQQYGYRCCRSCSVDYVDEEGNAWGYEFFFGRCSIKYSCLN